MANPTAAILIIGDEILSGRTQDTNTHFLARELTARGIDLREVRIVPDDQEAIVTALNALRARYDHVFTSGGIGPTHDDITADAIAAAHGVPISVRADARDILEKRYRAMGQELTPARLRMARIPETATLIDNPVSGAPGFSIGNVHVLAGVPSVFEAMVAAVLPGLAGGHPVLSQSLRLDRPESEIAEPLALLAADFPDLSIGSYPFSREGIYGTNIVVRGHDGTQVDAAMMRLAALFPEATR
jgi:molybdenum cofactor synthesis domain-containing protein